MAVNKESTLFDELIAKIAHDLDPDTISSEIGWSPLPGPQLMAYESLADELFYGGAAGGGKLLANNEPIVTPQGWKTHGEIQVGDYVCNPDGTVARVIAVFPYPDHDVYRVTFSDGSSVLAGDDHLWLVRKQGKESEWVVLSTRKLRESGLIDLWGRDRYEIPITAPVYFEPRPIRNDPYMYGVMLGDRGWGLRSKSVLNEYKFNSIEVRLDVLSGLLDTHGSVDKKRITYYSPSQQLAEDVKFLVQSLGGMAIVRERNRRGEREYRVYIYLPKSIVPFQHSEKRRLYEKYLDKLTVPKRTIRSIKYVGKMDCTCIAVDHLNQLYITADFIVTHNTDLLIGYAVTAAKKSILFRRTYPEMKHIVQRSHEILANTSARYNGQDYIWRDIPGGRILEFGSVPSAEDVMKYQGRPHDYIGFDEISNFLEGQYTFLIGWNRTEIPGLRSRVIAAGNPPTNVDGEWVVRRWAAWIDPSHPHKAQPGELRWYARIDNKDIEVESPPDGSRPKPIKWKGVHGMDEEIYPRSRTFIPAKVTDNPHYGKEYIANLQAMPEPFRSKMLYGDFGIVFEDDPYQVIPSAWVTMARLRWDTMFANGEIQALENVNSLFGLDVSEGAKDQTTLCKLTGNVVQWLEDSMETDLMKVADWVAKKVSQTNRAAFIGIDATGSGVGVYHRLRQLNMRAIGVRMQVATKLRDRTNQLEFVNIRSYLWWLLRDALDPYGEVQLAIPHHDLLLKELLVPRWEQAGNGKIRVEDRDSIVRRLGRSPDRATALMLALWVGKSQKPPMRMV